MASRQIGLVGAVALLVVGYVWIAAAPSSDVMDTSRDPQPTAPRPRRPAAMHPNAQAATQADAGFDAAEDAFSAFYVPPRFPQSGPDRVRCGDSMCLKRQERCCAGDEGTFCLTLGKPCPFTPTSTSVTKATTAHPPKCVVSLDEQHNARRARAFRSDENSAAETMNAPPAHVFWVPGVEPRSLGASSSRNCPRRLHLPALNCARRVDASSPAQSSGARRPSRPASAANQQTSPTVALGRDRDDGSQRRMDSRAACLTDKRQDRTLEGTESVGEGRRGEDGTCPALHAP